MVISKLPHGVKASGHSERYLQNVGGGVAFALRYVAQRRQ